MPHRPTRAPRLEPLEDRRTPAFAYALADGRLVSFDTAAPAVTSPPVAITGLPAGESLRDIDVRPADGRLYALGGTGRLYALDPATGAASAVGGPFAVPLTGTRFAFDFDPYQDRARVVSDSGQNFRVNPDTGEVVDSDPDTPGVQPDHPLGGLAGAAGAAYGPAYYSNPLTVDALYLVNPATDRLYTAPFSVYGPFTDVVAADIGPLGVDAESVHGLDVSPADGRLYAVLTVGGAQQLYEVGRAFGGATPLGAIGDGTRAVAGLAFAAPAGVIGFAAKGLATEEGEGPYAVTLTRTYGTHGAVTVDITPRLSGGGLPASPADFALDRTAVTFADGQATATLTLTIVDDNLYEKPLDYGDPLTDETFALELANPTGGALLDGTQSTLPVSIQDNELVPPAPVDLFAVGAGPGGWPQVNVYNSDATLRFAFLAYDAAFRGGVHVATADVTGDGVEDIVTAPGPGGGPHVKVFDGSTGNLLREWLAYDPAFRGGVSVAASDVYGPRRARIVTGAGPGGGPHVKVWAFDSGALLGQWMAYDPAFRGGVNVALGDIIAVSLHFVSPVEDVVTAPGPGGGPVVRVFTGEYSYALQTEFLAYGASFRGGLSVAVGSVGPSLLPGVITAPLAGGGPVVRMFQASYPPQSAGEFAAFDLDFRGGVTLAAMDADRDGKAERILAGAGPGGGPHVRVFDPVTGQGGGGLIAFDPAFLGGTFVG